MMQLFFFSFFHLNYSEFCASCIMQCDASLGKKIATRLNVKPSM